MAWSQEERPLPSLHSFEQIHKKVRTDVVQVESGIFIPFVPIMQIGAESFLVPLQWWYGAARQHGDLDDEGMFAGIVPVMLELGTRLCLEYRVEYHKLEYEELGRRIYFAQHCNSVRGACVLRDAAGKRIAKAYLGMGTEGQRPDVLSFLFSTRSLEAVEFLIMILLEQHRIAASRLGPLPPVRVSVNVTTDSPRDSAVSSGGGVMGRRFT